MLQNMLTRRARALLASLLFLAIAACDGQLQGSALLLLFQTPLLLTVLVDAGPRCSIALAILGGAIWSAFAFARLEQPAWIWILSEMTGRAGLMIVLAVAVGWTRRLAEHQQTLAETDPLTQLFNRRGFLSRAEMSLRRCTQRGEPFSILFGDVARFKSFNDEHGHQAGDAVLRCIADALRASTRQSDLIARWGGDEFLIALPRASESAAAQVAARIAENIPKTALSERPLGPPVRLTLGVAVADPTTTLNELIERAATDFHRVKSSRGT